MSERKQIIVVICLALIAFASLAAVSVFAYMPFETYAVYSGVEREESQSRVESFLSEAPSAPDVDLRPGSVNINAADAEELQKLPGIGEVLAQRIVEYREESGKFFSIDEIMEVEGIGEKRFRSIEAYLTVE